MKLAFCSMRGSPGVTTLTVVCAALWPEPCVLAEADPYGGVLANRYGLGGGPPNLMSLAAAGRHGMTEEVIWSACRQLPDGVSAVIAPEKPSEAKLGIEQLKLDSEAQSLDLFLDCGRYRPEVLSLGADVIVLVVNPILEQLNPMLELLPDITYGSALGVVLAGKGEYMVSEVSEHLKEYQQANVLGSLPYDPKGARAVFQEGPLALITRRSKLFRAAQKVARQLAYMRVQDVRASYPIGETQASNHLSQVGGESEQLAS